MNRQPFNHRSSQVLAVFRVMMAALFGVWVWFYLGQPVLGGELTYLIITAYVFYAMGMFAVARFDWWLDHRLALPAFVIDVCAYLAALHITQAAIFDFISPFITFFAFLMISAAVRWNQRILPVVAAVLVGSFLLAGLLLQLSGVDIDMTKFVMRFSYLGVLSLILMWFALNRSPFQVPRFTRAAGARFATAPAEALVYAMRVSGATGAALVWADEEEPRSTLYLAGSLGSGSTGLPPGVINGDDCEFPMLFNTRYHRALALDSSGKQFSNPRATGLGLASHLAIPEGVLVPLISATGNGQLVLCGIKALCWDDIMFGRNLAREIAQGLDEGVREGLAREMAVARVRTSLARDLHDSVAQSLAGTRFRLDSLREMAREGGDVLAELDKVSDGLRLEQEHIREVIDQLRHNEPSKRRFELGTELSELARFLAEQWQIEVVIEGTGRSLAVQPALGYEFQQILREAVANAARHGAAKHVGIWLETGEAGVVTLVIDDDGVGFAPTESTALPRSISERVAAMGGTLELISRKSPTRLEIHIPAKAHS